MLILRRRLMRGFAQLLLAVAAAMPVSGHAQGGKNAAVLRSVAGTVFQQPAGGQVRVVPAGTELAVGDTVGTQKGAFALVVFSDGSRVALRPESAMAIRGYSFKPDDPVNDQMSMQLLKGWLRVVSGQIGKRGDQAAFQLKANDTTIGIRGTDFAVRICDTDCDSDAQGDTEGILPQSGRLGRLLASAEPLRRLRDGVATLDVHTDTPLFLGDVLVVGDSQAAIGLDDGTRLVLGPGTRLALRAEEDARQRRAVRLDLLEGVMRVATPPRPRARLYALLVNAGQLVGLRADTAVDLVCESSVRPGALACEAASLASREGVADVLSVDGLRSLRPGARARLVEPATAPGASAESRGTPRPASDALVERLIDPRDIAPASVRPAGAGQRPEPGVYAAVFDGLISVANPAGRLLVPAGQGAFSPPDPKAPPRLLPVSPDFMERDRELERSRLAPDECIR